MSSPRDADLGQLRSLQDWYVRYQLQSVEGVSEVASVGGMVRQYQIVLDPERLRAYGIPHGKVITAVQAANRETGGSVVELGEAEYMVRATGYLRTLQDFRSIPLATAKGGVPVMLKDVARVQMGPEMRRGISELDGEGEVAGGIVVMRSGKNALETIAAVKAKIASLQSSLPQGVEIVETYDRSGLIERAVRHLRDKLIEEFAIVALVCALFLLHLRSAFVAIVTLPLGVLAAFIVMHYQGVNANIMSLGGIAIAIGAMVDASIIIIDNIHKKLEDWEHAGRPGDRTSVIVAAMQEVGPSIFFSLLVITVSFIPVFTLEGTEGRLFKPLAFTKTYSMGFAAVLAVTLTPALAAIIIRGRIRGEEKNPINRWLIAAYSPGAWSQGRSKQSRDSKKRSRRRASSAGACATATRTPTPTWRRASPRSRAGPCPRTSGHGCRPPSGPASRVLRRRRRAGGARRWLELAAHAGVSPGRGCQWCHSCQLPITCGELGPPPIPCQHPASSGGRRAAGWRPRPCRGARSSCRTSAVSS